MRSEHLLNLKPIQAVLVHMDPLGFPQGESHYNYPARTKIPLILDKRCSRMAGDHPSSLQAGALPQPCTLRVELPTDANLAIRIRARSLPVIKSFTRGVTTPKLIGYEVSTDATLFKNETQSGNIPMFANSSLSADSYGMPPIDIVLPTGLTDQILQITFYDRPLNDFIVEFWCDRNVAVEFGTVPTSSLFATRPAPGWVSCLSGDSYTTAIDALYPLAKSAGAHSTDKLFVTLMTATTWHGLYSTGMSMSMLSSTRSGSGNLKRLAVGDDEVVEGVPFGVGIPLVVDADAATVLSF